MNKSQGRILKYTGVSKREDCFSHGQFYVAYLLVCTLISLVYLASPHKYQNILLIRKFSEK